MSGPYDIVVLSADLILSGVATFVAIMVWSLTREPSWMLIVISVVIHFGDVTFQTLDRFGIIAVADVRVFGVPAFWLLIRVIPLLFLIAALVSMVRSRRV